MNKKILVTGASGYIGRYLTGELLCQDGEIVAQVRNLGKIPSGLGRKQKLTVMEGGLSDKKFLEKAVEGVSVVFHLASALRMFEKENELHQTNILGLKNLLSACQKGSQSLKFIFASSIDVEKRSSDYARSKLEGEKIIQEFCRKNPKINYVIARIGNVYGGKEGGMMEGLRQLINQNNWQSSVLYHFLGSKSLYLIEMKSLINKLVRLMNDPKVVNKTLTLVDKSLTVKELVEQLKRQKLVDALPKKIAFGPVLVKIWQLLGRVTRRGDLLVYLSLGK